MKAATTNPIFGLAASRYNEVWTADQYPPGDTFYYVNFTREKSGIAPSTHQFQVVCLGNVTNR
jgi:hypothetical protein